MEFWSSVAVNARWGTLNNGSSHQNWGFHVIAIIDQKVYDLSFNEAPLILSFNDYLDSMFIPKIPFAINGETFRVGGDGPFYSAEYAMEELQHYQVKIMKSDKDGNFTTIFENQKLIDFLKYNSDIKMMCRPYGTDSCINNKIAI
jgi:hypothetical protein